MQNLEIHEWHPSVGSTDIVIQIDNTRFHCHRVTLATASKYFNTMFNSQYCDSTSETISLDHNVISAETFEDVFRLIYDIGEVPITMENICPLLSAADYLELKPELEMVFTSFIEKNLPNQHMFEVASFAERTGRHSLFYHMTDYISCRLDSFSETSDFLESPLEVIKMIIDTSTLKKDIVVKATIQWINHKREERWKCFSQLSCLGMMAGVAPAEIESMARSLIPDGISDDEVASYLEELRGTSIDETLRVYWAFRDVMKHKILEASIHDTVNCKILRIGNRCGGVKKVTWDKSIIYSLNYMALYVNEGRGFGLLEFNSCTPDGEMLETLEPPMESSEEITEETCDEDKVISYYDFNDDLHLSGLPNVKQIYLYAAQKRTLHVYHCDTDEWNEIEVEKKGSWATIATCETSSTVYMVGGDFGHAYLRAYDCCTEKWRDDLPNPNHRYSKDAVMCVFNGELYLYKGSDRVFEIYDPSKNKWHASKPNPHIKAECPKRIVAYGDELWLFASERYINFKNAYIAYLYRPKSNSWRKYPLIMTAIQQQEVSSMDLNLEGPCFSDAVVSY